MNPVIQEELTGCAIASAAALAGLSYDQARQVANEIGIFAQDSRLWSDPASMRRLLKHLGLTVGDNEIPFQTWEVLPDCALLATKWHWEGNQPFWHWVVFTRESGVAYVLDSKKALKSHKRTDFGRIKPKWFIPVINPM